MKKLILLSFVFPIVARIFAAEVTSTAATAINSLGLDLLNKTAKADANALLSPYSIQSALVMTYAGANGVTRDEMAKALHLGSDETQVHNSFALLQHQIGGLMEQSTEASARWKQDGITKEPITLTIANRLFGQKDSSFHAAFLERLKTNYNAQLDAMDFAKNPAGAAKSINSWVEEQTKQRIRNLIPDGALSAITRLVLVNAIYLKAPWQEPFETSATKPLPFHVAGGATVDVSTMNIRKSFGYMKYKGFTAVTIPYDGGEIQFLILLPDAPNGLAGVESKLTQLAAYANLPTQEVVLYLPKFKIEPPTLPLSETLQTLGMKSAFDPFRANFDRMANDPLFISGVFHKTFLSLDEKGTEAAAATAVAIMKNSMVMNPPRPIEVHVDHPFLFAIQHRTSGACLFLGHVVDPR